MKNTFLIDSPLQLFLLLAFVLLPLTANSQSNDLQVLTEQNYRVLSGRVHKMLESRFKSPTLCSNATKQALLGRYRALPAYSEKKEVVVEALDLYYDSYQVDAECKKSLDKAERGFHGFERTKFSAVRKVVNKFCSYTPGISSILQDRSCQLSLHQFLADLDPHCVSVQVPNSSNSYDPFPCMAGDYLIARSLVTEASWKTFLLTMRKFLDAYRAHLASPASAKTGIDLFQLYRNGRPDTPELREEFLAALNFFYSSFHSASSYIRGFHDHIWAYVLFQSGSPKTAVAYFVASRLLVDEFRMLDDRAGKKKIALRMEQVPMKGKIRHDYMAAYLACHYRDESKLFSERLPVLMGFAYESFDFKSHLKEKVGLKVSARAFKIDTDRYRTGVKWGHRFCGG